MLPLVEGCDLWVKYSLKIVYMVCFDNLFFSICYTGPPGSNGNCPVRLDERTGEMFLVYLGNCTSLTKLCLISVRSY